MITYDDYILITDPWYYRKAFTTWTVKPPPFINPKLIIDLTKSKKLGFLISHHHFDHYDIEFLKKCNENTPIFITDFCENKEEKLPAVKSLYNSLIKHCNMKNIIEVSIGENKYVNFGPFKIMALRRPVPYVIDGILIAQTPDSFIMHCADCWGIPEDSYAGRILKKIKPNNIPSIYMGQAGTASGWPLIYNCYTDDEKKIILKEKTTNMLKNIQNTCKIFNIDKALGYAHLSYVYVDDIDYFTKYNYKPISGKEANNLLNCNLFLELQPSSIVLPSNNFNIINLISTLDLIDNFEDNMIKEEIKKLKFQEEHKIIIDKWLESLAILANEKLKNKIINEEDINIIFEVIITSDLNEETLYSNSIKLINGERKKIMKCKESIIVNVINGTIPFKDLDTGYLCEISRTPKEYYNSMFLMILGENAHSFFNCNIIDKDYNY